MPTLRLNDYDLAFVETGSGTPLVMIHGSLCDYRYWAPQMQPLGRHCRAIAVSLRHCWPEAWNGVGSGYDVEQHVDDLRALIERLDAGPVDLLGHSRGGYVALRLALRAPQQIGRLSNGLQQAAVAATGTGLIIGTDQETGRVARMGPPATQFPGAMALAATHSWQAVRRAYAITGSELATVGINTCFARCAR